MLGGLLIVAIGSLFLARELGVEIPFWVFSWKTLLIGIGLVLAIKHKFRHPGWIVLIGVGSVFLISDLYPALNFKPILWPSILILIGLAIMFKPRNKHLQERRLKCRQYASGSGIFTEAVVLNHTGVSMAIFLTGRNRLRTTT